jgi:hypothetical protein
MPKARAPLDYDRYQELRRQGLSLSQIAKELGLAKTTLWDRLQALQTAQASPGLPQADHGPPQGDRGTPQNLSHIHQGPPQGDQDARTPVVSLGPPQPDQAETAALADHTTPASHVGTPDVSQGGPPLYVHPGIPDDSEESVVGGEPIAEVHQGIPALPAQGTPQDSPGPPGGGLSPQLVEALTAAWPDLHRLLDWWRARDQSVQEPAAKLERVTYHVAPQWIEAVRREADLTGESYAAVVNRAFAQYFAGKST